MSRPVYIYALKKSGVIVYIGSTVNLRNRTSCHRRSGKDFDDVEILSLSTQKTRIMDEERAIKSAKPKLNKREACYPARSVWGDNPTVRVVAQIDRELYKQARQKAISLDLKGGFGEYVARLLAADMKNKGSAALRVARPLGGGK